MQQVICDAIKTKMVLNIYYGGIRTIEPHCYGLSSEGNELLRAYQTGGFTEFGETTGWKLFRIDKAGTISSTGEHFSGPRPGYNPSGDSAMKSIFCKL